MWLRSSLPCFYSFSIHVLFFSTFSAFLWTGYVLWFYLLNSLPFAYYQWLFDYFLAVVLVFTIYIFNLQVYAERKEHMSIEFHFSFLFFTYILLHIQTFYVCRTSHSTLPLLFALNNYLLKRWNDFLSLLYFSLISRALNFPLCRTKFPFSITLLLLTWFPLTFL